MKRRLLYICLNIIVALLLVNCESATSSDPDPVPDNPVPVVTSVSPDSKVSHLPAFTLTVTGSNFVSGSRIVFDGAEKATTFVSATEVSCIIQPVDISISEAAQLYGQGGGNQATNANVAVLVRNPAPGGGDSKSINFLIKEKHSFYIPQKISDAGGGLLPFSNIVVDGSGNPCAAWHNIDSGNNDMFFSRSDDRGGSWLQPKNISDNSGISVFGVLGIDPYGNLGIMWDDLTPGQWDVFFSTSSNQGDSWSQQVNVTSSAPSSGMPDFIYTTSGDIVAVWDEYISGNMEIVISFSKNGGDSWSAPLNISNTPGYSQYVDLAVDGDGRFFTVWADNTPGRWDVYFSRSVDNGATWIKPKNISSNSGISQFPMIGVDPSDNLVVVWSDTTDGDNDVYVSRSTNRGDVWTQSVNISDTSTTAYGPTLAIDVAGNINVVWSQKISRKQQVFYSRSLDGGGTWESGVNISQNSGFSRFPFIAVDSEGNIHVVWFEWKNGNNSVEYTASTR